MNKFINVWMFIKHRRIHPRKKMSAFIEDNEDKVKGKRSFESEEIFYHVINGRKVIAETK